MSFAVQLICHRVPTGFANERLADVAERIIKARAHHCVVLDENDQRFRGVIRLADIAARTNPGNRILGDLVREVLPVIVRDREAAGEVARMFEQHHLGEAVVLTPGEHYIGLITAESVLGWSQREYRFLASQLRLEKQARKKLEPELLSLASMKANLIAAVSHELRTPLNPILLVASERASHSSLPDDIRQDFQMIANSVIAQAQLVRELVDSIRKSSHLPRGQRAIVEVNPALDQALARALPPLAEKSVKVIRKPEANPWAIQIDPGELQQVFGHLMQALIATTPKKGEIQVECRSMPDLRHLEIMFSRSGAGYSAEKVAQIFEPVVVARRKEKSFPTVWSAGLTLAKLLVESHGGTIAAKSAGKKSGLTFILQFPLVDQPVAPIAEPIPKTKAGSDNELPLVLLIEDHVPSRLALRSLLQRRGYRTLEAGTAAEAIALAEKNSVSFIMSDIGLPDKNGYELMAILRQRFGLSGIALSGLSSAEDIARSKVAGFVLHLIKPASVATIEAGLATFFAQDPGR